MILDDPGLAGINPRSALGLTGIDSGIWGWDFLRNGIAQDCMGLPGIGPGIDLGSIPIHLQDRLGLFRIVRDCSAFCRVSEY